MKKILIYCFVVLFVSCMAKPKQPPLSLNETILFTEIRKSIEINSISREIDLFTSNLGEEMGLEDDKHYALKMDIPCENLKDKKKLEEQADSIVKELRRYVLTKDFKYECHTIYVTFCCTPCERMERCEMFDYER